MQKARNTTKFVVKNLVTFGISSTTSSIVHNNIRRSGNPVIDTLVVTSAFVTSWMVSSTIENPVHATANRQIDAVFDSIEAMKDIKNTDPETV